MDRPAAAPPAPAPLELRATMLSGSPLAVRLEFKANDDLEVAPGCYESPSDWTVYDATGDECPQKHPKGDERYDFAEARGPHQRWTCVDAGTTRVARVLLDDFDTADRPRPLSFRVCGLAVRATAPETFFLLARFPTHPPPRRGPRAARRRRRAALGTRAVF